MRTFPMFPRSTPEVAMKAKSFVFGVSAILVIAMLCTPNLATAQAAAASPAPAPTCTPPCPVPPAPKNECGSKSVEIKAFEAAQCAIGDGTTDGTYDDKVCHCDLEAANAGKNELNTLEFCRIASDEGTARRVHPKMFCESSQRLGVAASEARASAAALEGSPACKRVDAALLKLETPKPADIVACEKTPGLNRRVNTLVETVKAADAKATKAQVDVDATKEEIAKLKTEQTKLAEELLGAEAACEAVRLKGKSATIGEVEACKAKPGIKGRIAKIEELLAGLAQVVNAQNATIYGTINAADGSVNPDGLVQRMDRTERRIETVVDFVRRLQLRGGFTLGVNGGLQPVVSINNMLMRGSSNFGAGVGIYLAASDFRLMFSWGRAYEDVGLSTGGTGSVVGNAVHARGSYLGWKPAESISAGFSFGTRHGETNVSPAGGGARALANGLSPGFQAEWTPSEYLVVVFDATVGYEWAAAVNKGTGATPDGLTGSLALTFGVRSPAVTP